MLELASTTTTTTTITTITTITTTITTTIKPLLILSSVDYPTQMNQFEPADHNE